MKYYFNNFRPEWHQDALSSEIDESFPTDFIISRKILRRNNFRTLNRKNHNIYAQAREECEEKLAEMIKEIKTENAGTFAEKLMEHVMLFTGGHAPDDMTIVVSGIWEK